MVRCGEAKTGKGGGIVVLFQKWWNNESKQLSISWYRKAWSENGTGMIWRFRTNGARKNNPADRCLDVYLELGYLVLNYTDFNLQNENQVRS